MREIKFRIWNTYAKYWEKISSHPLDDIRIEGRIVQQYTGLKDTNNKEIYEGDIISVDYGGKRLGKAKVTFEDGGFYFMTQGYQQLCKLNIKFFKLKIIGNICEN